MSYREITRTQSSHKFPKINTQSSTILSSCSLNFKTHHSNASISPKSPSRSTQIRRNFSIKNSINRPTKITDSFYDVLDVPYNVNPLEIKRAYRELALKYHPDMSPPEKIEEYTEKFIRVQEAYETLSDPKTRVLYDMSNGIHLLNLVEEEFPKSQPSESTRTSQERSTEWGMYSENELFEKIWTIMGDRSTSGDFERICKIMDRKSRNRDRNKQKSSD